ncbi:fumarylacetoacetate hydrolase family protein [Streptomyces sp. NPDC056796]|uniref:fumarylacetoacetate hydrolase family protein n=1 Tax=Streptomyces sp. NPDC056796 TaxID=3345947 RepID=UPI0036B79EF9
MRLATIRLTRDRTAAARVDRRHVTLLPHTDVGALIGSGPDWARRAAAHTGETLPPHAAATTEPVLTPGRVLRVGTNYPSRGKELDEQFQQAPSMTITRPRTVVGARSALPLPDLAVSGPLTAWGVELGIVMASPARGIAAADALRHIAGYVVVCHLPALDGSTEPPCSPTGAESEAPSSALLVGPALVTADQLPPGGRGLTLTAELDSRPVQRANSSALHFDAATLTAHASTLTTLRPGDLITTGTPGGTLGSPLAPGRSLRVAIKGLGEIDAGFTAATAGHAP